MARPKRVFTTEEKNLIERYALNGGKNNTIALALDMPVNTLTNRFLGLLKKSRALRKLRLAEIQTKQAKTSTPMAIWLGKQELDQVDKQEIKTVIEAVEMTDEQRRALAEMSKDFKLRMA